MGSSDFDLWYGTSGPHDAALVLVGESWGAEELMARKPFIGTSGNELTRMLAEAGLRRDEILFTNVAAIKPSGNETWRLFHPRKSPSEKPVVRGLDPTDFVRSELSRLYRQIAAAPRRLVIAAGNYALWALSDCTGAVTLRESNQRKLPEDLYTQVPNGISNWRGSMWHVATAEPYRHAELDSTRTPLLPVVHPATIMRQWSQRAVTVHDLKLRTKLALAGDWRANPSPVFWAPPTFEQACLKLRFWLQLAESGKEIRLAEDIETNSSLITCVGLADSPHFAMSIPFVLRWDGGLQSYWPLEQEVVLIVLLRKLNSHPRIRIEGQNFIYDTQYFQNWMAVTPKLDWDSMLCQNVLFPGTPKGLDYLSSLYCKYHWYWKEDGKEWNAKGTIEDLLLYNCWDCVRTFEVCTVQRQMVAHYGQEAQMSFKMRVNDLCLRMMNRGIRVDKTKRAAVSLELMAAMQELEHDLSQIIPQAYVQDDAKTPWFRSDKQTAFLYYDRLGFDVQRDLKTGSRSVGKDARGQLAVLYPELSGLFNRLGAYGSIENSYDVVNAGLDSDDRMRCQFKPAGTETHRLSSSKNAFGRGMNLQNLTKGEEEE